MKTLQLFAIVLLAALPAACKSHSSTENDVPCTCGTPMGDLEGCAHSKCRTGEPNPDNPNCVCGKLDVPASTTK